jgi:antitoxin component of RelBE/YafQ-DinJ toxin-antitoxin module
MVERQRTRMLNVRIDDNEAEMLRALAEREGLSASDIVRQYIRRAYAATFPPKKPKR